MLDYIREETRFAWATILEWIKDNNISLTNYMLRVFFSIVAFAVISDILKKSFDKIGMKLTGREEVALSIKLMLGLIRAVILISVLSVIMTKLSLVEVHPLLTVTVSSCVVLILVIQGVLTQIIGNAVISIIKLIKGDDAVVVSGSRELHMPSVADYSSAGIKFRSFAKFVFRVTGIVLALIIVFVGYEGISYVLDANGQDVSLLIDMPEQHIAKQLNTKFRDYEDSVDGLPLYKGKSVTMRTDGDLNIIYVSGKQIGVNTTGRKYKFFNVAVNQSEISAVKHMTYQYKKSKEVLEDLSKGVSDSYVYYDEDANTALVLTINSESNRIVGLTYYSDLKTATNMISVDDY